MRFASAFAAALVVSTAGLAAGAGAPSAAISAAVADPARPAADTARDAERKPAQIVAFAGVKPGDKVAEMMPGGGYFTRILAKTVGPKGHIYALAASPDSWQPATWTGRKP